MREVAGLVRQIATSRAGNARWSRAETSTKAGLCRERFVDQAGDQRLVDCPPELGGRQRDAPL